MAAEEVAEVVEDAVVAVEAVADETLIQALPLKSLASFSLSLTALLIDSYVLEAGYFSHPCENDLVVWGTSGKIPFFNAIIYFENIEPLGKVDEIFGGPQENVSFI